MGLEYSPLPNEAPAVTGTNELTSDTEGTPVFSGIQRDAADTNKGRLLDSESTDPHTEGPRSTGIGDLLTSLAVLPLGATRSPSPGAPPHWLPLTRPTS
jgi:hypothetical protein